jgi:hypothetical protein
MRSLALALALGVILSAEAHGQATVFQNLALREIVALPIPGRDGVISFYIYPGSPSPFGNLGAGFAVNSVCAVGPGPNQGIWLSAADIEHPLREQCDQGSRRVPHTRGGCCAGHHGGLRCAHAPDPAVSPGPGASLLTAGKPHVRSVTCGVGCWGAGPSRGGVLLAGAGGVAPPRRPTRRGASPATALPAGWAV